MENDLDRIEVLPQSVIEKIAAGEIIERPASVLKELIENAIDAQATKIDITIEDAGFSCIRVVDNGRGMSPENLRKSILPHATSKIRSADDLYAISTMGFRGEALASIGAVSRLAITSSASDDGLGYSLNCDGGVAGTTVPRSHVRGTTVVAADLFFNVPARKKFMKTRKAERIWLMRLIEQVMLPYPSIHFTAAFEGKPVMDVPAVASVPDRISQIAGGAFAKNLVLCSGAREGMEVVLYISAPEDSRSKPRFQNLYVNKRRVESEQVLYAIREAFAQFTKSEFRPSFFCFIDSDPDRIDVNVHPTKLKVKFDDEKMLFGFIFATARQGLTSTLVGRSDVFPQPSGADIREEVFALNTERPGRPPIPVPLVREYPEKTYDFPGLAPQPENGQTVLAFPPAAKNDNKGLDSSGDTTIQLSDGDRNETWSLIACFQIHALYILAQIKNGILIIDQHAAHERVLYEQAIADLKKGRTDSQQLLFPIVIELSPTEKAVVQTGNRHFGVLGFEIHDFGGNAISVSAIPAFLKDSQAETAIRDMVHYLLDGNKVMHLSDTHKRFAAAFACGAAIKAGQKLSQEEMNALLNSLFGTENPYICPHGRPTLVRMSLDELSRRFLR